MEFGVRPPAYIKDMPEADRPVRVLGFDPATGSVDLFICPRVPEPSPNDFPGSQSQIEAVRRLFPQIGIDLMSSQCNALLSYRDYAVSVLDRLRITGMREAWIRIIATTISWHEDIARSVVKWSDDRFFQRRGDAKVRSTKFFNRICAECRAIEDQMHRLHQLGAGR